MKTHKLTYALALVAAMILAAGVTSMAQPSNTPAPERSGTLNAPAKFPILVGGKEIGASTLPAGTKVAVIREEGGKTLVKASLGETWVESAAVAVEEQPQPAAGTNGNSPVNLVPDGKGGSYAQPGTALAQPEPAAKPVRREDTAEYKSALEKLKGRKGVMKRMQWYYATPYCDMPRNFPIEVVNDLKHSISEEIYKGWNIVETPNPQKEHGWDKHGMCPNTNEKPGFQATPPPEDAPEKNEAYYDSLPIERFATKDTEAAFDALVWTDAMSLPTPARIKKQIESGVIVFLEKDCALALLKYPELKGLIPEPNKKSFDLVKKKNVAVFTIRGDDTRSKTMAEFFRGDTRTACNRQELDTSNLTVINFVNGFTRFANGAQ